MVVMTWKGTCRRFNSASCSSRIRRPCHLTKAQSRSTRSAVSSSARSSAPRLGSCDELVSRAAAASGDSGRWNGAVDGSSSARTSVSVARFPSTRGADCR
ncbi:hypothetical protein ACFFX0_18955 [Citricoccus parietis]|uniref:Uncharacterized protein n=1 Tax=Citricoccus parietis TaxID=592307 RepID=A0ABV5G2L1_9MICC